MPATILKMRAELRAIGDERTTGPSAGRVESRFAMPGSPRFGHGQRANIPMRRVLCPALEFALNDECADQLFGAASTMAAKLSAFRAAPPTNAPSMSGQPSRALALSGLTLPP